MRMNPSTARGLGSLREGAGLNTIRASLIRYRVPQDWRHPVGATVTTSMSLEHVREHVWAEILAAAAVPGGAQLRRERAAVVLGMSQVEVDAVVCTLADLLPERFAAALELAIDCIPLPSLLGRLF